MRQEINLSSLSPVGGIRRAAPDTATDFASVAMRTIRNLQKQLRDLGESYQHEMANPHTAGPAEQELLRDLAKQIEGVKQEIEAIQRSIVENQAIEGMKKQKAQQQRTAAGAVGSPSGAKSAEASSSNAKPEAVHQLLQLDGTAAPVPEGTVGENIDTSA